MSSSIWTCNRAQNFHEDPSSSGCQDALVRHPSNHISGQHLDQSSVSENSERLHEAVVHTTDKSSAS